MFSNSFRIGSVRGITIKIDPSWFLIALLAGFIFWGQFTTRYEHETATAVALAAVAAVLFFSSVLAHELGHALEAQHRGVHVAGITLFLFGGVTETRFDVERPFDEFALTAVGPYISFVLAAAFGLVATWAGVAGYALVADVTGVIAWINLLLAVFNLLPGAPLDGGRIVRAIAWKITGDRPKAIRIASRSGQVIGGLVIALGLSQAFLAGQLIAGLFNAFIGWFLFQAAGSEIRQSETREALQGRDLGSIVGPTPRAIEADEPLTEVAERMARSGADVHPVERRGEIIGVVHVRDVAEVERSRRRQVRLGEVATRMDAVKKLQIDTPLPDALEQVQREQVIAVLEGNELAGLLTSGDLERNLNRLQDLQGEPRRRRRRRRSGHLPSDRPAEPAPGEHAGGRT